MTAVFYADGFEESEGMIPVDLLRRAGEKVITVSVTESREVLSLHGITVLADLAWKEFRPEEYDVLIVPGGKTGVEKLKEFEQLGSVLRAHFAAGKLTCAICAGPSVLGQAGILENRKYTCFPGWEKDSFHGTCTAETVVHDGNLITGRAMNWSVDFTREIIRTVCPGKLAAVDAGIQYGI